MSRVGWSVCWPDQSEPFWVVPAEAGVLCELCSASSVPAAYSLERGAFGPRLNYCRDHLEMTIEWATVERWTPPSVL